MGLACVASANSAGTDWNRATFGQHPSGHTSRSSSSSPAVDAAGAGQRSGAIHPGTVRHDQAAGTTLAKVLNHHDLLFYCYTVPSQSS